MGNLRRIGPLPLPEASSEPCIHVSVYLCSPNLSEGMPLAGVLVHLKGNGAHSWHSPWEGTAPLLQVVLAEQFNDFEAGPQLVSLSVARISP